MKAILWLKALIVLIFVADVSYTLHYYKKDDKDLPEVFDNLVRDMDGITSDSKDALDSKDCLPDSKDAKDIIYCPEPYPVYYPPIYIPSPPPRRRPPPPPPEITPHNPVSES
jgi:hypothetical protein